MLNSTRYLAVDYNLSFANQQFSRAYGDASVFGVKYFGMDELVTRSNISPVDHKTLYPLFVFDVTKQSEKLKTSVVDLQIRAFFDAAVPAGTQAYAVVISDKLLTFQSDGNKMSVVFEQILTILKNFLSIKMRTLLQLKAASKQHNIQCSYINNDEIIALLFIDK